MNRCAYEVYDHSNEVAAVVYAMSRADAIRRYVAEHTDNHDAPIDAKRARQFDCYAPKGPTRVQLFRDHRWRMNCDGVCGRDIDPCVHYSEDVDGFEIVIDEPHDIIHCTLPECAVEAKRYAASKDARDAQSTAGVC